MPFYTFHDSTNDEIVEHKLSISEYDTFVKLNPHLIRYHDISTIPSMVSGVGGIKNDSGWKDVLSKIGEKHPDSELNRNVNKKSIKQVKTEQIIKKHLNKK